jgi:hypothetical protein
LLNRFFLKYVSRDEVELLGHGIGGLEEIKRSIEDYNEVSPLFGFLRYRRRHVLLKYVPEGCSRLLQGESRNLIEQLHFAHRVTDRSIARATVHFNAFSEKFTPYDTIFPIANSNDLKDSTLSAACSLHTASHSASSSTSSTRNRPLTEIVEDENEDKRQSLLIKDKLEASESPFTTSSAPQLISTLSPIQSPDSQSTTSHQSTAFDVETVSPSVTMESRPLSPTKSLDGRRKSSQSIRPDLYSYSSSGSNGRPKVKLGPRPLLDRPQTSTSSTSQRPVSTLPAGLKLISKNVKPGKEEAELANNPLALTIGVTTPPHDDIAQMDQPYTPFTRPRTSGGRPKTSSGASIRSGFTANALEPKTPSVTPEKMRLMKALQLRKKQLEAANQAQADIPSVPEVRPPQHGPPDLADRGTDSNAEGKAESAMAMETPSRQECAPSELSGTITSTPNSPVDTIEEGHSTQPSSVSDHYDETTQQEKVEEPRLQSLEIAITLPQEVSSTAAVASEDLEPATTIAESVGLAEATGAGLEERGHKHANAQPDSSSVHSSNTTSNDCENDKTVPRQGTILGASEIAQHAAQTASAQAVLPSIEGEASMLPSKQLTIPTSKFSAQHSEASDDEVPLEQSDIPIVHIAETPIVHISAIAGSDLISDSPSPDFTFPMAVTDPDGNTERQGRQKRRAAIEPIRTDLSLERSGSDLDADLLSDDDLMAELQSATVQEAKPISVTKSPVSATFTHTREPNRFSRAFSNPFAAKPKLLSPEAAMPAPGPVPSRSLSATYLSRVNQQQTLPIVKKANLGTGISQRIKALEKATTGPTHAAVTVSPSVGTAPGFFMVRQSSRAGSKSPSVRESPFASREGSPETSKIRERSESLQSRFEKFDVRQNTSHSHKRGAESVSLSARIVRNPGQPFSQKPFQAQNQLEYSSLELQRSPPGVNHQRAVSALPLVNSEPVIERRLSNPKKDGKKDRRSSISMVKDLMSDRRSSTTLRRKSLSMEQPEQSHAHHSSSRPPSTQQSAEKSRPLSVSSYVSSSSLNGMSSPGSEDITEKRSNRASRMFKRMSLTLSSSRKSLANVLSGTLREETEPPVSPGESLSSQHIASPTIEVGDVNVQFPDTLLWKRRAMSLDHQGFLLLSQVRGYKGLEKSAVTKRYHISEFRTPFVPEIELQELPNSVVLDFIEGGGLQVACEDRGGQMRVLQSTSFERLSNVFR